ncbi:MAG TPA: glycosyltransferase, partial [Candidatus Krumholzibacteria bacterium]|nr:glycosyltransferase [Candidatus Krumholzibacteria bacterium]
MSSSRPRVTYVIDDLGHGGAQRQLALTLGALDGAVESTVVVLSDIVHPYAERIRELGVPVEVIPRRAGLEARRVSALARTLGRFHTRIAHATLDGSDAYTYFAAHACRIPAVLSLRSDRLHVTGGRARVLRWMMRHASAITVNSQAGRTFLEKDLGVHPGRIHRVANIVDVPASPAPVRPQPGVIGVVGRLVDIKRFDVVIDA